MMRQKCGLPRLQIQHMVLLAVDIRFREHSMVFSKTKSKNSKEKPAALRNAQKPHAAHAAFAQALQYISESYLQFQTKFLHTKLWHGVLIHVKVWLSFEWHWLIGELRPG